MLKKVQLPLWSAPLLLLLVCILSFGLLIPDLGFYWDDWAKTLVQKVFGPSGYWDYYAEDRPLSAWTHIALNPILGSKPLNWHIFTLALRWLTVCSMWFCLLELWPNKKNQALFAALLFSVFPVFTLQPIPVTLHQQWMQYLLFFVSVFFMISAVKKPSRFWVFTAISVIMLLLQLTITEYFAPLEFIRPFIIFILLKDGSKKASEEIKNTLKHSSPYLIILAVYLAWRLFFIKLPGADPYRPEYLYSFFSQPLQTMSQLFEIMIKDVIHVVISNWAKVLELGLYENNLKYVVMTWLVGIFSGSVVAIYLMLFGKHTSEYEKVGRKNSWILEVLLLGSVAMLLGCVPAWISGRQVVFDYHSNRYAMAAMFGSSLMTIACLEWLTDNLRKKAIILGIIIALTTGYHLRIADEYRTIWANQKDFYWQLSWRAPYIEPNTAIITEEELFPEQGLFSTSSAINLLYPQPGNQGTLAYWVYSLRPRYANLGSDPLTLNFNTQFRTLRFLGKSPNSILVYYYPGRSNCLWVINEDDKQNPNLPSLTRQTTYLSNLDRILDVTAVRGYPSQDMFGEEPYHGWCYLYQKADLAKQHKNWAEVVNLGETAQEMGYTPDTSGSNFANEWIPFIEGYAQEKHWDTTLSLTLAAFIEQPESVDMLCTLWGRINDSVMDSEEKQKNIVQVNTILECD